MVEDAELAEGGLGLGLAGEEEGVLGEELVGLVGGFAEEFEAEVFQA